MQTSSLWFEKRGEKSQDRSIILLHGFTGSHSTWDRLSKKLVGEHYFLVLPDLPGHGRSADTSGMSIDQISDSLIAILDDLKITKASILGYSMGARIALNLAIRYPGRARSLILESGTPGIRDDAERQKRRLDDGFLAEDIKRRGLNWFVDYWENLGMFASQKSLDERTRQMIRNERLTNSPIGLASSLEASGAGVMLPMWSKLGEVLVPVLLLVGEKDEKYVSIAKEMKRELSGKSSLFVIRNSGHAPHIENYLEFEKVVANFLQEFGLGRRNLK